MNPTPSPVVPLPESGGAQLVRLVNAESMRLQRESGELPARATPYTEERQAPVAGINPQEFGRLEAEVAALRRDNDRLMALMEKVEKKLERIESKLSEARGGWRALMVIGGVSAATGGALMGFAQKLFKVLG